MTATETLIHHILTDHRMGEGFAGVDSDPELSDVWEEIQADPVGWHKGDHEDHRVPLTVDHSTIEWGA